MTHLKEKLCPVPKHVQVTAFLSEMSNKSATSYDALPLFQLKGTLFRYFCLNAQQLGRSVSVEVARRMCRSMAVCASRPR
jgi:hypothetical protein